MSSPIELLTHVFGEGRGIVGTSSGFRATAGGKTLDGPRSAYFRWPHEGEVALEWLLDQDRRHRETYFCAHLLTSGRRVKANAAPLSTLSGRESEPPDLLRRGRPGPEG